MTELPVDWVPFSARYGINRRDDLEVPDWWSRHVGPLEESLLRCACPGSSYSIGCRLQATQEDRLCNACREHCWAIDDVKVYHRLIDVYGPSKVRAST